ncbi:TPA: ead/Ea22-like family protein [Enterobacter hormaechei]
MSNIDKRALREAAEKAGSDKWQAKKINGDFYVIRNGSYEKQDGITSYQPIAEIEHKPVRDFVAEANPATVLALLDELEAKDKRIAELSSAVIAPGVMRCAGCGFVLTKNNISMSAGAITAGDSKTEPCPNGCGPLWPVTWKEQAIQFRDDSEQWFEKLQEARQRIAELELKLQAADKLQDSAFRHGLQHGFSYGQTDDQAGFEECLSAYGIGKGE